MRLNVLYWLGYRLVIHCFWIILILVDILHWLIDWLMSHYILPLDFYRNILRHLLLNRNSLNYLLFYIFDFLSLVGNILDSAPSRNRLQLIWSLAIYRLTLNILHLRLLVILLLNCSLLILRKLLVLSVSLRLLIMRRWLISLLIINRVSLSLWILRKFRRTHVFLS